MVPIKTHTANKSNYGGSRSTSTIKYLVIHYTGNDGDSDQNNGKYFANNVVKASAHYFVDSDSITQSVPDNYVAYSVGGNKYANTKGAKFYGQCTNANSISIELCDDVKDGVIYPSAKTIQNAIELTQMLMQKYNIPADRVIRHYDVTGKICPAYWVDDAKWKAEFWNKLTDSTHIVQMLQDTPVADLNTLCKKNVKYTITDEKTVGGVKYGKLKSGAGWIDLTHTK